MIIMTKKSCNTTTTMIAPQNLFYQKISEMLRACNLACMAADLACLSCPEISCRVMKVAVSSSGPSSRILIGVGTLLLLFHEIVKGPSGDRQKTVGESAPKLVTQLCCSNLHNGQRKKGKLGKKVHKSFLGHCRTYVYVYIYIYKWV